MKKIILILFGFFHFSILFAQIPTQTIRGKILDAFNNKSINEVNIVLLNTNFSAVSTENGSFTIEKVPAGRYQLQITHISYQTQTIQELLVVSGKENVLDIQLIPNTSSLNEVVISGFRADATRQGAASVATITNEAVLRYPATFLDPARLAMAMPGVVNDNDQANGMVIRGNNPNTMGWMLEGLEIVNPNHLTNAGTTDDKPTANAGGTTALSAQLMDKTTLFSGAYSAEYGNALGGIMDVRLRNGNDKKWEFTGQAGLIGMDIAAEGPVGKGSVLANYRYSTVGLLSVMGLKFGDEDIRFQDFSFKYHLPTANNGAINIFGTWGKSSNLFASNRDTTEWKYEKDNQDINYYGDLAIIGITHQYNFKNQKTVWKTGLAYSNNYNKRESIAYNGKFNVLSKNSYTLNFSKTTFNSHIKHYFDNKKALTMGVQVMNIENRFDSNITTKENTSLNSSGIYFQPYADLNNYFGDKLSLNIGIRLNSYIYSAQTTAAIDPKASLQYKINTKSNFTIAYGLQSQALPFYGNYTTPILSQAHHFVLSYQQQLNKSWSIKIEPYYQKLNKLTGTFAKSELHINFTKEFLMPFNATNYGIEFSTQKSFTNGFYAFANATIYNAKYLDPFRNNQEFNTRFNGNYAANFSIGKEWTKEKRNKQVVLGTNARITQVGGYRYTPEGNNAEPFSAKYQDYFRLDTRFYWKRNKQKYSSTLSLDIQNTTNAQNIAFTYFDTRQKTNVIKYQLGLIPILNYRVEF